MTKHTTSISSSETPPPPCRSCGEDPEEIHDREWSFGCSCYNTGFYKNRQAALEAWYKRQARPTAVDLLVLSEFKKLAGKSSRED